MALLDCIFDKISSELKIYFRVQFSDFHSRNFHNLDIKLKSKFLACTTLI